MHTEDTSHVDLDAGLDRSDRRTMIRHRRELAVTLETLQMTGTSPWPGWTQDLSAEGACLAIGRRFEPGTPVAITFDEGTALPLRILAKVVRVEAARHGWLLGCRFIQPVDSEEFRLLLQEVAPKPKPVPELEAPSPPDPVAAADATPQRLDLRSVREKLKRINEALKRKPDER